jgi:hypothetical protein
VDWQAIQANRPFGTEYWEGQTEMSFFSRILNFFSPPKQRTSMEPVKEALEQPRVRARDSRGRYIGDDPLTEEDEAWIRDHPTPYKKKNNE